MPRPYDLGVFITKTPQVKREHLMSAGEARLVDERVRPGEATTCSTREEKEAFGTNKNNTKQAIGASKLNRTKTFRKRRAQLPSLLLSLLSARLNLIRYLTSRFSTPR